LNKLSDRKILIAFHFYLECKFSINCFNFYLSINSLFSM